MIKRTAMGLPIAAGLAWGIVASVALLSLLTAVLMILDQSYSQSVVLVVNDIMGVMGTCLFALVGALIVSRQPRNTIGWIMLVFAVSYIGEGLAAKYALYGLLVNPGLLPGATFAAWLSNWLWAGIMLVFLIPLLFPTGRPRLARGWWVAGGLIAYTFVFALVGALAPEIDLESGRLVLDNPLSPVPKDWLAPGDQIQNILYIPALLLVVISVLSLGVRFRNASREERQQIKWLLAAVALLVATVLLGFLPDPGLFESVIPTLAVIGIPIAIGIAILRYRLFDIDLIIRKTLTYALVVALLALVYFGSVILLQQVFATVSGQRSEVITVLSTLAIAALFIPLRNRIQSVIDRRFYRRKYDAQKVLERFAATARDETDLKKLTGQLIEVVEETMQPQAVSVRLKSEGKSK